MKSSESVFNTPDETFDFGQEIGGLLTGGEVLLLYGGLGAGKTLLTKGILAALDFDVDEVTSPSFSLVNLYKAPRFEVYHIDLWRLDGPGNAGEAVGLDEILENERAVTIIEWADRLGQFSFTNKTIRITIDGDGDEPRRIKVEPARLRIATLRDPSIVIKKAARTLELFDGDALVKIYEIRLGFSPGGDKEVEGDGRTPEGDFYAFVKNNKSKYAASLGVSYPSAEDAERGLAAGLIPETEADSIKSAIQTLTMPPQKTRLGGEIYIHGGGIENDWTEGCIALNDEDMVELFDSVPAGVRIRILP